MIEIQALSLSMAALGQLLRLMDGALPIEDVPDHIRRRLVAEEFAAERDGQTIHITSRGMVLALGLPLVITDPVF